MKWPWFILGFLLVAALVTWVPALASVSGFVVTLGRRALVLSLFLIGLALSSGTLRAVGVRPLVLGVLLWVIVASVSLPLAMYGS